MMQQQQDDNRIAGQAARMADSPRSPFPEGISPLSPSPPTVPFLSTSSRIGTIHRETPRAAAAFQSYAELGPERSLSKLAELLGKKSGYTRQLETWSSWFHWVERARQYDAQEAEKRRKKNAEAIERMNDEQALIGRTHLLRAVSAMEPILKAGEAPFPSLVSLFKYSAELERLARGAATSRLEGDVSIVVQPKEYINLSPDECGSEE